MSDAGELRKEIAIQPKWIFKYSQMLHDVRALHQPEDGRAFRWCSTCGPPYDVEWPCETYLAAGGSANDKPIA